MVVRQRMRQGQMHEELRPQEQGLVAVRLAGRQEGLAAVEAVQHLEEGLQGVVPTLAELLAVPWAAAPEVVRGQVRPVALLAGLLVAHVVVLHLVPLAVLQVVLE